MNNTIPEILQHSIKIEDPNLDHISRDLYKSILYEPSDDSFLFMEALEKDLNTILILLTQNNIFQPKLLELGPGSGILGSYAARLLSTASSSQHPILNQNELKPSIIALDINPIAVEMTKQTLLKNNPNITIEVYESDLLQSFPEKYYGYINILLFNPPYVPSEDYEYQNRNPNDMIMNAYAGGPKGRVILDQFLPLIPSLYTQLKQNDENCTINTNINKENNQNENIINTNENTTTTSTATSTTPTTIIDKLSPFIFYCVVLWPVNDINDLNKQMNYQLQQYYQQHGDINYHLRHYKSHLIMGRQCGLESLTIIRYIPDEIFTLLPIEYQSLHPLAHEENMQAIFKPVFLPPTTTNTHDNNDINEKNDVDNDNPWNRHDTNESESNSDSDVEEGFSVF